MKARRGRRARPPIACPFSALTHVHFLVEREPQPDPVNWLAEVTVSAAGRVPVVIYLPPVGRPIGMIRAETLLHLLRLHFIARRPPPPAAPVERARAPRARRHTR